MNEQDKQLSQLIAQACQHPQGSREWQRAIDLLLHELQGIPKFKHRSYRIICPDEDLFNDALNRIWVWFSLNLSSFKPPKSRIRNALVNWLGSHLYWRIKDIVKNRYHETLLYYSLDAPINADSDGEQISRLEQLSAQGRILGTPSNPYVLSGLEIYIESLQKQKNQRLVQGLEFYIEQDPDRRLRECHPRRYPECNSQLLSLRLLPISKNPTDNLASISREFDIKYPTLVSHWKLKTLPLLQEIAITLGYSESQLN